MRSQRLRGALGVAAALFLATGCALNVSTTPHDDAAADTDTSADALGHVHGLGVDPGDGTLYAATHFDVFRVDGDGSLTRVADRWQDTMAITVIGPGRFLASGHPDLREDLPAHLGLIESLDAAESWAVVSLGGEADFHALDVSGARVYGYDATSSRILTTTDRTSWTTVAIGAVIDLAADPVDSDRVISSALDGTLRLYSLGSPEPNVLEDSPRLVRLEWLAKGGLVGVTAVGRVYRSDDAGASWTSAGRVPGNPVAFDATEEDGHVATDRGIHRSADGGRTWSVVVAAEH